MNMKKIKIKLKKTHEHAGEIYKEGDILEVRQDQAQRLRAWGIATDIKKEDKLQDKNIKKEG